MEESYNKELERIYKLYLSDASLYSRKPRRRRIKLDDEKLSQLKKIKPQYENFVFSRVVFNESLKNEFINFTRLNN